MGGEAIRVCFARRTHLNVWDAHELQEAPALFVVFACDLDLPARELVDLCGRARLLRLLLALLCLLTLFKPLRELQG